jgi:AcrR family transcriptional regulator
MEKTLKSRATVNRMQQKGLELFYQKGYYNTSLDDILKALELSKGAFYHHFQSKEDFMISIVQHLLFRKVYSMLIEPVEGKEDPLRHIETCLENALEIAEHNTMDFGFVLGNFMTEFNGRNEKIARYLNDICKAWEVSLVTALQKGKSDGYLERHLDSEGIAIYVMASYFGVRSLMVAGNARMLRYQYVQQLRSYFKLLSPRAAF